MAGKERPSRSSKFVIIGILVIVTYVTPWLIIGIWHWSVVAFDWSTKNDISYIVFISVCAAAWVTSFHLWSRVSRLEEGKIRKLFLMTGFTFVVIVGIFTYMIINTMEPWFGFPSITGSINAAIPEIDFKLFGLIQIRMPADSIVTFALLLLAITFYIYPMEKYVKQKLPWHTISMLICTAIIPLLLVARNSEILLSIGTFGVVLWVLYNFVFLFYLYFSLGISAPTGTPLRRASILIGVGLLFIIFVWIAQWAIYTGTLLLDFAIQMSFGAASFLCFNYGYYLINK
ncbi:MAG TPA: hypothetical protein VKK79_02700 [Candidatus Lokiarchaeia archaeon]|nr:hypothetical protein [Candidatus Lokiarchaeia archaeon]